MSAAERTGWKLTLLVMLMLGIAGLALYWVRHRRPTVDAVLQARVDSLAAAGAMWRDSTIVYREQARVAAVAVARTDTVYRERVKTLGARPIVTVHHDTVYLDTVAEVKAVTLACSETIAARDTALSVCAREQAALRSLFGTDTLRRETRYTLLQRERDRAVRQAKASGRKQGAVLTALAFVAAAVTVHQLR